MSIKKAEQVIAGELLDPLLSPPNKSFAVMVDLCREGKERKKSFEKGVQPLRKLRLVLIVQ